MAGDGLDRPAHKWFAGKTPRTAVDASLIADQMIRPDASRLFDENARVVWIGPPPVRQEDGLVLHGASSVPQEFVAEVNRYGGAMPGAIGVPEEQLREAAKLSVCKINIDSDLRLARINSVGTKIVNCRISWC
jgi:hypothetical protein